MYDLSNGWPKAATLDGVTVVEGLRVLDYNLDLGTVTGVQSIDNVGTPWFTVTLDRGGKSMMDGLRMWTRLRTSSGLLIAANQCDCGDLDCDCGCVMGNYPCEHGSAGAGCGA